MDAAKLKVLVTGATGYVGGQLLKRLSASQFEIRCLVRDPKKIRDPLPGSVSVEQGDLLSYDSVAKSLQGIDVAFYLVHSMDSKSEFQQLESEAAENFAKAAAQNGVKRIIYLGALTAENEADLSPHLQSRKDVGDLLRKSGAQVFEFQASIVLGAGSLSYEMIKALSERLPIMIMPRWVSVKAQPICIKDALDYLVQAIDLKMEGNQTFEIGGPDQVSYKELMQEYSRQRGLRRLFISVPVLTPWLSSLWLALVTPVYATVGKKLILSIKTPTLVKNDRPRQIFKNIEPMSVTDAIAYALKSNPS
ncbi:MAG: NAD(P)H-binding protein [Candidatus Nitrohelix vancouverensis]|uniref:NAD(P)H-binding protein n=1 Tax=Candidatus Nitrohelix vancouverensis TaxID=2705534 RepID=A0A7T0C1C1_9BACT|nr:MAG: NAD(P)H-binding protein [Candidatus Nitrohelix vancouverensis]